MSESTNRIEPPLGAADGTAPAAGLNDAPLADGAPAPEIVSVNSSTGGGSTVAKTLFILLCAAVLVGLLAWLGQNYLNAWKQSAKGAKKEIGAEVDPMNPEATRAPVTKVGAASGRAPPLQGATPAAGPATHDNDTVRAIRGADGKVMTDPQGRALGVDTTGKVVPVPAIAALPGPAAAPLASAPPPAGPPPPSRYGGALFVEQSILRAAAAHTSPAVTSAGSAAPGGAAPTPTATAQQQGLDMLRSLMPGAQRPAGAGTVPATVGSGAGPVPAASPYGAAGGDAVPMGISGMPGAGGQSSATPSITTVANTQVATRTPVVQARLFPDQNLMIPKGRQAGCVLTTRIDDQLPGYTSCVLAEDLFSDNGKTLLLEHGSEIWGEYGTLGQPGLTRIAVNWVRVKTRDGITVDLSSPGTDALGGSGLPGHYNPRWGERIGAAVLLSLVKDVTTAIINNQSKSGGTTVSVAPPGQNTIGGSGNIADQVVRETLRVRPNVTLAEGTRISIYVARDLDFRPVYELRHAAKLARATAEAP